MTSNADDSASHSLSMEEKPNFLAPGSSEQGQACKFCQIVLGRLDAEKIWSTEEWTAFLDYRPLQLGHTLVVPNRHVPDFLSIDAYLIEPFFVGCQAVARAVMDATGSQGIFFAINNRVSQSVPHLHAHVVPRNRGDGLKGFFWPRRKYESKEQSASFAKAIRSALKEQLRKA
jgi:histidine triad (HIT) family protein